MSDFVVPNIIDFQTQKQLVTLNNIQVLIKCVLIDLRARNSVHAKISLRARCVRAICRDLLTYVFQCPHNVRILL